MTTRIVIDGDKATAHGPFSFPFTKVLASLSGRKNWNGSKSVSFKSVGVNIDRLKDSGFPITIEDRTGVLKARDDLASMETQHAVVKRARSKYKPRLKLMKHQQQCIDLSWDRAFYAIFLEAGLGKTTTCVTNAGMLYSAGRLRGVLVVAPAGVHEQWVTEQIPVHIDPLVVWEAQFWQSQKRVTHDPSKWKDGGLHFFTINVDALRTKKGFAAANAFIDAMGGKVMMAIDESQDISGWDAARTKAALRLGERCEFRRIMSGTPLGKDLSKMFPQFMFLDPRILGHAYLSSFKARYCVEYEDPDNPRRRFVVASKNVEEFYTKTAPHVFRLTKGEALDLPPKHYVRRVYEMDTKTREHYLRMLKACVAELEDGKLVLASHAMVQRLRLQQIVSGYLPVPGNDIDDGKRVTVERFSHQRLDEMSDIIDQRTGSIVIWARFKEDIDAICKRLAKDHKAEPAVSYYGLTPQTQREPNRLAFVSGKARFFVSNPASGGTGLNLQGGCRTNIYFSNSFDAIKRWQSEDRTHRIGTKDAVTYFDLIANRSVDDEILKNLKGKKDLANLTLDDLRIAIDTFR